MGRAGFRTPDVEAGFNPKRLVLTHLVRVTEAQAAAELCVVEDRHYVTVVATTIALATGVEFLASYPYSIVVEDGVPVLIADFSEAINGGWFSSGQGSTPNSKGDAQANRTKAVK